MKKTLLLLLLLPVLAAAQSEQTLPSHEALKADIQANLFRAALNEVHYEYAPGPRTPAPSGYKPFYISHYGRHGARSNWAGKKYASVQKKYAAAAQAGVLTPEGLAAKEQIDEAIRIHDNMDGRLSPLGVQEHRDIAGRMYRSYKRVFTKGSKKITARSSVVPRVLVSMASFTGELLSCQGDLVISLDTGEELMKILSTDSPRPVTDSVKRILARHRQTHVPDTSAFMARIFTDVAKGRALTGNPVTLMQETFDMGTTTSAFGLDDRLFRLFSLEELCAYEQYVALSFYLRQCNSVEFGDDRMPSVDPLITDIIEKADAAIAGAEVAADLRFGHDYQVLALGSRLGLDGIAQRYTATECLDWPGWRYTPFAANIQLIFYRNRKGDVLVKPLLNERETRILGLDGFPYYRWEDYKAWLIAHWPAPTAMETVNTF